MAVVKTNEQNFSEDVLTNQKDVLVDFYADWCGPCKMLSPIVEALSDEHPEIAFYKLNIDEAMSVAVKYGIVSIPTLILFRNGEAVSRTIGYQSKEEIEKNLLAKQ